MHYKYCDKNLIEEKETYQYSQYCGEDFVDAFFDNRKNFLEQIKQNSKDLFKENLKSNTFDFLKDFYNNPSDISRFALLLKKFEVTKRIFENTDENFKKLENSKSDNLNLYILFSNCCYIAYQKKKHLSFVNAMLKCNDILCSQKDFSLFDTKMLIRAIENEIRLIKEIKNGI